MEAAKHDLEIGVWCTANERKIIVPIIVFRRNNEFLQQSNAYSDIIICSVTVSYVSRSESVKLCFVSNPENRAYLIIHIVCKKQKNIGKEKVRIARQELCLVLRSILSQTIEISTEKMVFHERK
jgi:hypothetical protein